MTLLVWHSTDAVIPTIHGRDGSLKLKDPPGGQPAQRKIQKTFIFRRSCNSTAFELV
jgi:hypothetical protein